MGLHGHNGHPLDCQPRSQSHDVVKSDPPQKRGGTEMAGGSIVGQGQASKHAIANQIKLKKRGARPSFIGENAAIHRIGLSQRLSWQYSHS